MTHSMLVYGIQEDDLAQVEWPLVVRKIKKRVGMVPNFYDRSTELYCVFATPVVIFHLRPHVTVNFPSGTITGVPGI